MKKIDRETQQRILDAADIVEVVSDFVTLKRRGANWIGLCPFHNERTPSFSVSKSRGICKCFSCGKGGSPVNFLMELESMSYQEALRWLARKYNIEIKEHEMTDAERQQEMERESMLAVNDFAMNYFEKTMADTDDGRNIGMAYFRERGITEQSCRKFHLGYSLENPDDLFKTAVAKGFSEKFLVATGLCARNERGVYDRFRGRVIYPVFSISGKVVAFGGRTLRSDKKMAKYVNSPESVIYSKSRELYGLYQAKQAITRKDKCILVEGYMDVISLHQSGVENVVASSGTSLTEGQIRLIHRFTGNVTVIYDSDPAGIKASLRGIDMLLAEGLNVKTLLLPEGDDPDSFAQSHTNEEVENYLNANERDFIHFKSDILLKDAENDPIRRAQAISEIVRSIAVIPDAITQQVYIDECSRRFGIDEKILRLQIDKFSAERAEEEAGRRARERAEATISDIARQQPPVQQTPSTDQAASTPATQTPAPSSTGEARMLRRIRFLEPYEREVLRYVFRYGVIRLCDAFEDDGTTVPMSVIDYVAGELAADEISFCVPAHALGWQKACAIATASWADDLARHEAELKDRCAARRREGIDRIREEASDLSDIKAREIRLESETEAFENEERAAFARRYIERVLLSDPDDSLRRLATDLVSDKYTLSKVHTKYARVETEEERLEELVPRALFELKDAILQCDLVDVKEKIKEAAATNDSEATLRLMQEMMELNAIRADFASYLGERIINPRKI